MAQSRRRATCAQIAFEVRPGQVPGPGAGASDLAGARISVGEAFWESPDIIVVPTGTSVTATTPAGDPTVIAGKQYDLYVRVHNDYTCAFVDGVRARVWWGDATLANTTWTDVITNGPDSSNPHWSATTLVCMTER
jgi:hypothetical protein